MSNAQVAKKVREMRGVIAWLCFPAFLSMFIAHQTMIAKYILPWPQPLPVPKELQYLLWWRNLSLLILVSCAVLSFPRWQSIIGLVVLVIFLALFGNL